jgi:hypothetical protein
MVGQPIRPPRGVDARLGKERNPSLKEEEVIKAFSRATCVHVPRKASPTPPQQLQPKGIKYPQYWERSLLLAHRRRRIEYNGKQRIQLPSGGLLCCRKLCRRINPEHPLLHA